jgi:hypothetical protein
MRERISFNGYHLADQEASQHQGDQGAGRLRPRDSDQGKARNPIETRREQPMKLADFIRENREELDRCIARALGQDTNPLANDAERRLWVLNDEGLYNWARSEGVRI